MKNSMSAACSETKRDLSISYLCCSDYITLGAMTDIARGQAIYTDKVDYMPGDAVTLNGLRMETW